MIHLTIFIPRKKHFFRLFLLLNVNDICRYFGNPKFRFLNIASLNKANRIIVKYIVRFSLTRHRFFIRSVFVFPWIIVEKRLLFFNGPGLSTSRPGFFGSHSFSLRFQRIALAPHGWSKI
jgi:hypothetical protein